MRDPAPCTRNRPSGKKPSSTSIQSFQPMLIHELVSKSPSNRARAAFPNKPLTQTGSSVVGRAGLASRPVRSANRQPYSPIRVTTKPRGSGLPEGTMA